MKALPAFDADVAKLARKYPRLREDVNAFINLLEADPLHYRGQQMRGLGSIEVYKARVMSRDLQRGKSGGFRVIVAFQEDDYLFVHLYSHSGTSPSGRDESALRQEIKRRLGL